MKFSVFLSVALCASSLAGDWPSFRGPTGDGHAVVESLPLKWSATEGVKWKVGLPGKGWSSPVIVDGKIYLTTAVAEGENQDAQGPDRELRVLCLGAADGKIQWDTKVFDQEGAKAPKIHKKNSHASPTVWVADGKIYAHFGHMGTACLDLAGKVLWQQDTLSYPPTHGNGSSPLLADGLLIYSADAAKGPFIVALHADTGKVAWKKPRPETDASRKFSFATPSLTPDGKQLISPCSGAVISYNPKNGDELWRVDYDQGYSVIPKPVFHKDMVFIATGYDKPNVLGIRIDADSKGNVTESHLVWEITKRAPHTPSMLVVDGLLYFISDGGTASCVDPATGEVIWQERAAGPMSASPVYAAGRIYIQDEKGVCTVLKPGREFKKLAENDIGERSLASFGITEGAIFLRTETQLFRIGE